MNPNIELAFLHMLSTCWLKHSLESTNTPRYLTQSTVSRFLYYALENTGVLLRVTETTIH